MRQLVKSYYRGNEETTAPTNDDLGEALIAVVLLGSVLLILAIMLWQITAAFGTAYITGKVIKQKIEARQELEASGLKVTVMAGKQKLI